MRWLLLISGVAALLSTMLPFPVSYLLASFAYAFLLIDEAG